MQQIQVIIKHIDELPDGSAAALVHVVDAGLPRGVLVDEVAVPAARRREIAAEAGGAADDEYRLLVSEVVERAKDVHAHARSTAATRRVTAHELERLCGASCFTVGAHAKAGASEEERTRPASQLERMRKAAGMHRPPPDAPGPKQPPRRKNA